MLDTLEKSAEAVRRAQALTGSPACFGRCRNITRGFSDVPGLLSDPKDPSSLIKSINIEKANALIADGTISGGMIPKIRSAIDALNAGVRKVHFVDGRLPHALLLEIFTDGGIGTEVTL